MTSMTARTEFPTAILLEQYKLCVEMADRVSSRHHQANSFFLSLNSLIITAVGLLKDFDKTIVVIVLSLTGSVIAYTWTRAIRSYRDINKGKFIVIQKLEERLPAQAFKDEWAALCEGNEPSVYLPFTAVEQRVPRLFMVLYLGVLIWTIGPVGLEAVYWLR